MCVVGIDLGTSNSALSIIADEANTPEIVPVTQLVSAGELAELNLLPSALYLKTTSEVEQQTATLPRSSNTSFVVGEYAKERAVTAPDRVVLSAKSWLCHAAIDRKAKLLPWNAQLEVEKVSPLQASAIYLEHLRKNLIKHSETSNRKTDPEEVVIAVPASFDEAARILTLEAAKQAGFDKVTLIEEPLAALYAWISTQQDQWRGQVNPGDVILVCDVGGGTADFSVVVATDKAGTLNLDRISVGDHILLGGDNMDLALALRLKLEIEKQKKIDRWQFMSLVQAARKGKETLFSDMNRQEVSLAIAGRGSSLISSAITVQLNREMLEQTIIEGFFPRVDIDQQPEQKKSIGLQEFGLPYASEAALSKHLAYFLQHSLVSLNASEELLKNITNLEEHSKAGFLKPNKILFNGGVFKAISLRTRVLEILNSWCGAEIRELPGADYDLAVARGAAVFAQIQKNGTGLRIRAKTARSYYLGVESSMPAVPGYTHPLQAICVVPKGLEEGSSIKLPAREFSLVTGELTEFRFFSSTARANDVAGTLIDEAEISLDESARLEVLLPAQENKRELLPVTLEAKVNDVGALELWLLHTKSSQRWKLEFNVRG